MKSITFQAIWLGLLILSWSEQLRGGQTPSFIYQGVLNDGANPANGKFDFRYQLFDAATDGNALGGSVETLAVGVTNGVVRTTFGFDPVFLVGSQRWIEVGVRSAGSAGTYDGLPPRQIILDPPAGLYTVGGSTGVGNTSTNFSPGRVLVSTANNTIDASGIDAGTLLALQGVTGPIQSQLDAKVSLLAGVAQDFTINNLIVNRGLGIPFQKGINFQTPDANFSFSTVSACFNGTRDDVSVWGYNYVPGGVAGKVNPTQPSMTLQLESDYNYDGINHLMEFNLSYVSADNQVFRRPMSMVLDRATHSPTWLFRTGADANNVDIATLVMRDGRVGIRTSIMDEVLSVNGSEIGDGIGLYYSAYSVPGVRGILKHGGESGGAGMFGGLQLIAQGSSRSLTGAGNINFFTPTTNSSALGVDAPLALRMTISHPGNVGINQFYPASTLAVGGNLAVGTNYSGTWHSVTNGLVVEGCVGIGTLSPAGKLHVAGTAVFDGLANLNGGARIGATSRAIDFHDSGSNTRFRIISAAGVNYLQSMSYDGAANAPLIIHGRSGDRLESLTLYSQKTVLSGQVGVGTSSPAASSLLELSSTTQGFVLPRMTRNQRNAIVQPGAGMLIYQSDSLPGLRVFNGLAWVRFSEIVD